MADALAAASFALNDVPGMRDKVLKIAQYTLRLVAVRLGMLAATDGAKSAEQMRKVAALLSLCRKATTIFETLREANTVLGAAKSFARHPCAETTGALVSSAADFTAQANFEVRGGVEG